MPRDAKPKRGVVDQKQGNAVQRRVHSRQDGRFALFKLNVLENQRQLVVDAVCEQGHHRVALQRKLFFDAEKVGALNEHGVVRTLNQLKVERAIGPDELARHLNAIIGVDDAHDALQWLAAHRIDEGALHLGRGQRLGLHRQREGVEVEVIDFLGFGTGVVQVSAFAVDGEIILRALAVHQRANVLGLLPVPAYPVGFVNIEIAKIQQLPPRAEVQHVVERVIKRADFALAGIDNGANVFGGAPLPVAQLMGEIDVGQPETAQPVGSKIERVFVLRECGLRVPGR